MSFSNEQITAINHIYGPALVLAGPGSGKTTVITHRIMHLLSIGVPPDKILVITFTRDAAMEMEARFKKLLPESVNQVSFGTFHSIFFYILRLRYDLSFKNIITDRNKTLLLRELTAREHIDSSYDTDFFRLLLSEISKYKSMGENGFSFKSKLIDNDKFHRIIASYQSELKEQRLLDFDDMLLLCHELFLREPDELKLWQNKYSFILVDEFQDINPVQYSIVRMLAEPENNLFIVGDDDQSIYRFRGAEPSIMLGFEKDYPATRRILLSNNYRSRSEIVNFAKKMIAHNRERFPKDIKAINGHGGTTLYYKAGTPKAEYAQVIRNILKELSSGIPFSEIAILFRTEMMVQPLAAELTRHQIPFCLKNKVKNIYECSQALDIISYLKLSENMGTRADFLRIMNKPLRYISRKALDGREMSFDKLKSYYSRSTGMQRIIDTMLHDLKTLKKLPTYAAIIYIRKKIGYEDHLYACQKENHVNPEKLRDIMDEIEESSRAFPDKKKWLQYVASYGNELRNTRQEQHDGIRLMTFHGSKGLEFDIVHLVDINEGIVPSSRVVSPADLEEERRAFYVALTRARREFHIYFTEQRYSKHCSPSRFIYEGLK